MTYLGTQHPISSEPVTTSTETELLQAYGTRLRKERCICGGTLVAVDGAPIEEVVALHIASAAHVLWRVMRGDCE